MRTQLSVLEYRAARGRLDRIVNFQKEKHGKRRRRNLQDLQHPPHLRLEHLAHLAHGRGRQQHNMQTVRGSQGVHADARAREHRRRKREDFTAPCPTRTTWCNTTTARNTTTRGACLRLTHDRRASSYAQKRSHGSTHAACRTPRATTGCHNVLHALTTATAACAITGAPVAMGMPATTGTGEACQGCAVAR